MSGGITSNVRLVKCPKCSRVLPELNDVPVYRCGGCGVVLQAKNRKTKIEETKPVPSESLLAQTEELENNNKESDCSQNENHILLTRDQVKYLQENDSTERVTETEGGNLSNEHCVDNGVAASDNGIAGQNEQQDVACNLKASSKDEEHVARELFVGTNPPNLPSSPVKQTSYGPEQDAILVGSPSYVSGSDTEKLPFDHKNGSTAECQSNELVQGSQEIIIHENEDEDEDNYDSAGVGADEILMKSKRRPTVATGDTRLGNASLPLEGVYGGSESVNERASIFNSPVSEELQSFGAKSSSPNEDDYARGSIHSDVDQSLPIGKGGHSQSQTSSPNVYEGVKRENKLEGTAAVPRSIKQSDTLEKISKSATARSGYGYDGSISSYEDQYDHIDPQTFRDVNYVENDGKRNFNDNQVSGITTMQQQAQEFFRSGNNYKTTQRSSWSPPMESDEIMRHQTRHQMGFEAEMYPSRVPFSNRNYENDGFNSDYWDGMRSDSSMYSADKLPYSENKRIELLKMVHELQEELSKSPTSQEDVDRRNISQFEYITQLSRGRQMAVHHTRREFMDEADRQSMYSRHSVSRSEQGTNWPRQQNQSWIPYSGEVTNHRHHDEYYYQHRQPMDQRFSAQLAPSVCSLNAGLQRVHLHPGEQFLNPYSSATSSPRRYVESDFPLRVEDMNYEDRRPMEPDYPSRVRNVTYSDQRLIDRYFEASLANSSIATDHMLKEDMKIIHAREKHLRVKRHIRPIAGGSPFITCYRCWSMLQLPADFFLFKRRLQQLKCGFCSEILKFSVEDRTHLVPYVHDYRASPREVKGGSLVISPTSNSHYHGTQMSCSDHEFGNSFDRSFSTKGRNQESLAAPVHAAQVSNAAGRKKSSGGSSDIIEGKKKWFSKPFSSKNRYSIGSPESSSTNRTSNIEDYSSGSKSPKGRTGSPLHKLMGYTSISQVFRGPIKGTSESFRNKSTR